MSDPGGPSDPNDSGDPFVDPRHPDRPTHPDFYRLMSAVNFLDGETTEGGRDSMEVVAGFVDVESLHYMALQRAKHLSKATGLPVAPLAAIFLDGFAVGVRFEQEGGHRDA